MTATACEPMNQSTEPPIPEDANAPEDEATPENALQLVDIVEYVLKDQRRLDRWLRNPIAAAEAIPKFLIVGLAGYAIFAVALTMIYCSAETWPKLSPMAEWLSGDKRYLVEFVTPPASIAWIVGSAFNIAVAYGVGMIAAIGICLPSFYFFGLLAGVRVTMLEVAAHAMKGIATSAIALVGILPIYLAAVLGMIVLGVPSTFADLVHRVGMLLPFVGGLWGLQSLYFGFVGLADTMPEEIRCRRACFLRRLTASWAACHTAVGPLMIYTLWEYLSR